MGTIAGLHYGNLPKFCEDLVAVFSALLEVVWVCAKNVNKLIQSGMVSLVRPCTYLGNDA